MRRSLDRPAALYKWHLPLLLQMLVTSGCGLLAGVQDLPPADDAARRDGATPSRVDAEGDGTRARPDSALSDAFADVDALQREASSLLDDGGATLLPYDYATNGLGSHWTLVFDEEFNTTFSTPTGLDPTKWATGWGVTDNGAPTWPVPGDNSDPNDWAICDPEMNVVATGTVGGRSGGFLWQSVAYKPQTDVDLSNYAQGCVQSNPSWGDATWGADPGAQFAPDVYVEASIWTSTDGNGQMYDWPSFWLASANAPATGEIDVFEGIGGLPNYQWNNGSSSPGGSVGGDWAGWHTYGAYWTASVVTWYYDGVDVGRVSSGILSDPQFIILSMGYPSHDGSNDWAPTVDASGPAGFGKVPEQITDYVRVWSP
jgi:hypothetical protein